MASSIAYAMGAEAPRQADPAIPLVTDMVDEVLNGGKADRVLIYNPDCIGLWMYQKYTEDLRPGAARNTAGSADCHSGPLLDAGVLWFYVHRCFA